MKYISYEKFLNVSKIFLRASVFVKTLCFCSSCSFIVKASGVSFVAAVHLTICLDTFKKSASKFENHEVMTKS